MADNFYARYPVNGGGVTSLNGETGAVNLVAGSNITITPVGQNITIASTGASGSTRSISSLSTPTTLGATAGTDYVALVSGTTTITMPTAVGNTNLYTIKNVGSGTVTINTTSSQTMDGSLTIVMAVKYTSVDLISDGANWNVV
jgi:hypothetical protein